VAGGEDEVDRPGARGARDAAHRYRHDPDAERAELRREHDLAVLDAPQPGANDSTRGSIARRDDLPPRRPAVAGLIEPRTWARPSGSDVGEGVDRDHLTGVSLRCLLDFTLCPQRGKVPARAGLVDQARNGGTQIRRRSSTYRTVLVGAAAAGRCLGQSGSIRCGGDCPVPGGETLLARRRSWQRLPEREPSGTQKHRRSGCRAQAANSTSKDESGHCYPFSLAPTGLAVGLALKRSRYA
jgi:hypothetical protein